MIDGSLVTIILVVIGMGITIMAFQWRQNVAMEKRLRGDNQALERRIETTESRLRRDNQELEERLRGDNQALERRIETIEADVKTLIGEVGLVKGALLGVSDEIPRPVSERESAPTS